MTGSAEETRIQLRKASLKSRLIAADLDRLFKEEGTTTVFTSPMILPVKPIIIDHPNLEPAVRLLLSGIRYRYTLTGK